MHFLNSTGNDQIPTPNDDSERKSAQLGQCVVGHKDTFEFHTKFLKGLPNR